jgi:hypothetical protein
LDQVDPKIIEASKGVGSREKTDKTFHKRDIGRKVKNGVAKKVMRLKLVEVKKPVEEI